MSMPTPFELGRAIGGNISGGLSEARETNALDRILQNVQRSNDPNLQNDVIRQILTRVSPEKREAALAVLQNKQNQMQKETQREAYAETGLNPNLPESINRELIKQQTAQMKEKNAGYEDINRANQSLSLINRGREILRTGHLGPKIGIGGTGRKAGSTLSAEGRRLRAEYAQIGKALVQAAAPLRITNRAEFLHYAEGLEDPDATWEQIEGSLDALERIVRSSVQQYSQPSEQSPATEESQQNKNKPPLSSFVRYG